MVPEEAPSSSEAQGFAALISGEVRPRALAKARELAERLAQAVQAGERTALLKSARELRNAAIGSPMRCGRAAGSGQGGPRRGQAE